ncbi:tRNA (guanine(9)-N1)-methyltransferase [Nakaseomyces bracarensis]|uniref:tRNA (guanine(9)-N1)-methyltransferase n=1 Tax=Nakaseomyces bracarensis TaxID=273131 RepID=A0ABR4NP72_9SACH
MSVQDNATSGEGDKASGSATGNDTGNATTTTDTNTNTNTTGRPMIREEYKLPPVPTGMSKSQWKKQWKRQVFEMRKEEFAEVRREKRRRLKENRRKKIQEYLDRGEEVPAELKREPRVKKDQKASGITIVLDCAFDDLMNDKEIVSTSNQITRAYSANRRSDHYADVKVTSFGKRLKERFDGALADTNYPAWTHFEFQDNEDILHQEDKSKLVYLTADTDEQLETLEPGMTYIVGGIVDKNRHKLLCYNKAKELGIATRRLPISEYIKIEGRKVLTTTHVIQIMLKYFDSRDWKQAFEAILPARKLDASKDQLDTESQQESESESDSQ